LVGRIELVILLTLPLAAFLGHQGPGRPNWIIESPAYMLLFSLGLFCCGVTNLWFNRASAKLYLAHNRWQLKWVPTALLPLWRRLFPPTPYKTQRIAVILGFALMSLFGAGLLTLSALALTGVLPVR
jgi:hypothetical protein